MSIRAYRIIEIKLAEKPSFTLWDNSKFLKFLEEKTDFLVNLNSSGTGQAEIPVKILEKAIKMSDILNIDKNTMALINNDIYYAKLNGNDSIIYDCF